MTSFANLISSWLLPSEFATLFLLWTGGAFGSLGLRFCRCLGASVLVAELSALAFGLLVDPGFRPGFLRGGFWSAGLSATPGGLTMMLELLLLAELLKSFWNCADGDPASGLERGGEERSLGETLRAPSWVRRRSAAIIEVD